MLARTIAVPTTPSNLYTLLGLAHCDRGVALQTPSTNAAPVYFGDQGQQPAFIPAGSSSDVLPVNSLSDLYILGTSGDSIIILVF